MAKQEAIENLTFEEALSRVEAIVAAIEEGKIGLQETVSESARARKLLDHCEGILKDAEAKLEKLRLAGDGTLTPEPMDEPEAAGEPE